VRTSNDPRPVEKSAGHRAPKKALARLALYSVVALFLMHCGGCAKEAKRPVPAAEPETASQTPADEESAEDRAPAKAEEERSDEAEGKGAPMSPPPASAPEAEAPSGGGFAPPPSAPKRSQRPAEPAQRVRGPNGEQWLLEDAKRESLEWERKERNALSLSKPDCKTAREHRDNICRLAERICDLRPQGPNTVSITDYCTDARTRCGDATERYSDVCE
jgi:hypothetical protein